MNSKQRTWARLNGEPVDRLPALPIFMVYASELIGARYEDYCKDHRVLVEGNMTLVDRYGIDCVSCCSYPWAEAADCGAELVYYPDQPPDCPRPLIQQTSDLLTLKRPEPLNGRHMSERLAAIELFKQKTAGETCIQGWVEGPMAEAADLRGINQIMLETITDLKFVRDLMDWVTELAIDFALAQIEAGADLIGVGDAAASLVNPAFYRDEIAPREKRIIRAIQEHGARARLHICGKIKGKYETIASINPDLLDVDYPQEMKEVRAGVGPGICLSGNLNPVSEIKDSRPDSIKKRFKQVHEESGERYILAAGCEIPPQTPEENVLAMFDYARENF